TGVPSSAFAAEPPRLSSSLMALTPSILRGSDQDIFTATLHDDLFRVFQSANDVYDPLLGLFDLSQADRTTDLHLFLQGLRGAGGLIAEDSLLQLFARAPHRQRKILAVDLSQYALQ